MVKIIERRYDTVPNNQENSLEFYALMDMAVAGNSEKLCQLGFRHVALHAGISQGPVSYFYHENGTIVSLRAYVKGEIKHNPFVRIISNDESSINNVKRSLENLTNKPLFEVN